MILNLSSEHLKFWSSVVTQFASWDKDWSIPKLQAHRGYWVEGAGQNSMESLAAAKSKGFDIAEIDIQITKDGIPVLCHDENLFKILKKNIFIDELTYKDLCDLHFFPTLKEVLLSKNRPFFLNVEIKSKNIYQFNLEKQVIDVLFQTNSENDVIISCFNPWSLIYFKNKAPKIPRAMLVTHEKELWNLEYLKKMWLLPLIKPTFIHMNYIMWEQQYQSVMSQFDIPVSLWTVNNSDQAVKFLNLGIKSIITDSICEIA